MLDQKQDFLSIVIVSYNSLKSIRFCLESILTQKAQKFEIIVVDNGSTDLTVDFIRNAYPEVKLVINKENLGACKARNQGIELAKGEWILTLDSDTRLKDNFLKLALDILSETEKEIGIVQPKILNSDQNTIFSCGLKLTFFRKFYDIGKGSIVNPKFDKPSIIFGSCCASSFYRREMLEDIKEKWGYFDERFFFLVEDVDVAWRAKRFGWKTLYRPDIVCFHEGNSSGTPKNIRQRLCFRNRFMMIEKNEGLAIYSLRILPVLLYDMPRFLYLFIKNISLTEDLHKKYSRHQCCS